MTEQPVQWIKNKFKTTLKANAQLQEMLPSELPRKIRGFHRQLPGYRMSPLKGLSNLAAKLGVGGIWVKDESARLDLRSFKVLGGSYAIYKLLQKRLGLEDQELSFADLTHGSTREKLGDITFARRTDAIPLAGNHFRCQPYSSDLLC